MRVRAALRHLRHPAPSSAINLAAPPWLPQAAPNLIAQQALVERVGAHAERVLQGEVHRERRQPLPEGPHALLLDDRLPAIQDACERAGSSTLAAVTARG